MDGTLYQNGETVTQITTNVEGLAETTEDQPSYSGLIPGEEYTIEAYLMDSDPEVVYSFQTG